MSFIDILHKEWKAIFAQSNIVLVIFGGSLLYLMLYPIPYHNDVVRKQIIAIIDKDSTASSLELIFFVSASPQLHVHYVTPSEEQARKDIVDGKIYGTLTIPEYFEENLYKGVPSVALFQANASYFLIYGTIIEGLNAAITAFSTQTRLKRYLNKATPPHNNDSNLIHLESIPLYNPSIGYTQYALAAVLIFVLHQTSLIASMMLGAVQNTQNKQGIIGYWNESSPFLLILARILCFSALYGVLFLLFCGKAFEWYAISTHAQIIDFLCFAFIFIFACIALGTFLGLLITDESLPAQIILISSLPLIFIMGFIWPHELLPKFLQIFTLFIPAYHGISGFIKLNQMGASFEDIMPHFYALILIFIFCFVVSCIIKHRKYVSLRNTI